MANNYKSTHDKFKNKKFQRSFKRKKGSTNT